MALDISPFERYRSLIDDWGAFREALSRPLPTCLWVNELRCDAPTVIDRFEARGFELQPMAWRPGAFRVSGATKLGNSVEFKTGLIHLQEEVSMIPVHVLDPQPGERVADLCAAPGNKTVQLGVMMGNRGTVVANDAHYGRIRGIRMNSQRLGLCNVSISHADATSLPRDTGLFDRILVDVPCSCEGNSRKSAAALRRIRPQQYEKESGPQKAILKRALELTRPGGRVVYSTCTYAPEENELVLDAVLRQMGSDFARILPISLPGLQSSSGVTQWQGRELHPDLSHCVRVYPHQNDTGGFFVALLERGPESRCETSSDVSRVSDRVERAGVERCVELLEERFGIESSSLDGMIPFRWSDKFASLVNEDHLGSPAPELVSLGVPFFHMKMAVPRLCTAAAFLVGNRATRNVIDLDSNQAEHFLWRQTVDVAAAQLTDCTGRGYVIARHDGLILGMGMFRGEPENGGAVESFYPKGWSVAPGRPVFPRGDSAEA